MPINATDPYDEGNIFARILRGELPCNKVFEDEHALVVYPDHPFATVSATSSGLWKSFQRAAQSS